MPFAQYYRKQQIYKHVTTVVRQYFAQVFWAIMIHVGVRPHQVSLIHQTKYVCFYNMWLIKNETDIWQMFNTFATEKGPAAKSGHLKQLDFFIMTNKNWSSIYSTMLDQGWNLLIETLLRTFPFVRVRRRQSFFFYPLLTKMSHHNLKINQNLFHVHTLDLFTALRNGIIAL